MSLILETVKKLEGSLKISFEKNISPCKTALRCVRSFVPRELRVLKILLEVDRVKLNIIF